jgi:hypothetical protein
MRKSITLTTEIPASRELQIVLPDDVPIGTASNVITVAPSTAPSERTFGDLLNSEFFGIWRDRTDIPDSENFARKLRSESWKRPTG